MSVQDPNNPKWTWTGEAIGQGQLVCTRCGCQREERRYFDRGTSDERDAHYDAGVRFPGPAALFCHPGYRHVPTGTPSVCLSRSGREWLDRIAAHGPVPQPSDQRLIGRGRP